MHAYAWPHGPFGMHSSACTAERPFRMPHGPFRMHSSTGALARGPKGEGEGGI